MEINQVLPTITPGDAVSNECLRIQELLTGMGFASKIYAENIDKRLSSRALPYRSYKGSSENFLIFHYSIGSDITAYVKALNDKKVIWYHNITPHGYFEGYNPNISYLCKKGRDELPSMRAAVIGAIADSEYNKNELLDMGFKGVDVLPVILDLDSYGREKPDQRVLNTYKGGTNIIFVGKMSPNKSQMELIKVFYYYKKYIDSSARLIMIGSYEGYERYYEEIKERIKTLGLKDVIMPGKVTFGELIAYYSVASIFLCMSDHEGFCVPLVEAMLFHVPIVAYGSTAVPYTLGGSGVLFNDKHRSAEIAELADVVLKDKELKRKIIDGQDKKLKDYETKHVEDMFKMMIGNIIKRGNERT